jgi:hypothetical protein
VETGVWVQLAVRDGVAVIEPVGEIVGVRVIVTVGVTVRV